MIHVHNDLRLEVSGHASMKGVSLSARSLEAFFGSLLLESMKDISTSSSQSYGAGFSEKDLSNVSTMISKGERHAVGEITSILGAEKCQMVVANALRLNGGMIAAAHRAADGSYSDHGLLTLKVGELFLQHIYEHDKGYTLGMAVNSEAFAPSAGGHSSTGTVYGTIGKGDLTCDSGTGCEDEKLNRKVEKPRDWTDHYNVETIHAYLPKDGIPSLPRDKDGNIDYSKAKENIKKTLDGGYETVMSWFGVKDDVKIPQIKTPDKSKLNQEDKAIVEAFERVTLDIVIETPLLEDGHELTKDEVDQKFVIAVGKKSKELLEKYAEFVAEYPMLAEYGLSAVNVVAQFCIAGPFGAAHALKSEGIGQAINAAAGDQIAAAFAVAVDKGAVELQSSVKGLEYEDAAALVAVSALVGVAAVSGAGAIKGIMKKVDFKDFHSVKVEAAKFNKNDIGDYASDVNAKDKLHKQMLSEEAASLFESSGALKKEIVDRADEIQLNGGIRNQKLIQELTADGSAITDWGKFTTGEFRSPQGIGEVHFYKNKITGQIYYDRDFKFKLRD